MSIDQKAKQYLDRYLSSLDENERGKQTIYGADHFCSDEENANICADLVPRGIKVATCSLKEWYLSGEEPMPKVGDLFVVTNWDGEPTSIIETTSVTESRYCDVSEEFAAAEGEGDQSLEWWREAHWDFFSRECEELGIVPSETMMLVLERFKVVYSE